jgi:hypothetical protein
MSEGRPNQRGLQLDAQASLDHLLGRDDVSSSSIVVFGRSLGGAVAIHLAAENQEKVGWIVCSQRVIGFQPAELTRTSSAGHMAMCSGQVSHPKHRVFACHMTCCVLHIKALSLDNTIMSVQDMVRQPTTPKAVQLLSAESVHACLPTCSG